MVNTKTAAFSAAMSLNIDYTSLTQISKVHIERIKSYAHIPSILWNNIPPELLEQPRWITTLNGTPIRDWSNPENQTVPNETTKAFDISSHSPEYPDYLLMDWDDVYDPTTNKFTSEMAEKVFYWVLINLPVTYVELSKSKQGFHMLVKPNNLQPITNGTHNVVKFTKTSKLEMFYKNKARLAVLTGYSLGEPVIADEVDDFITELLAEIHKFNNYKQPSTTGNQLFTFEQDQIRARKMLEYIPVTKLSRTEWRTVTRCWKDLQLPYTIIDEWSKPDSRYNDGKDADMDVTWENMEPGDPLIAIKTLCSYAEKYGGYNSVDHWDSKFWSQFQLEELTEGKCTDTIQQYLQSPEKLTSEILRAVAFIELTHSNPDLLFQFKAVCKKSGITVTELNQQLTPHKNLISQMLTNKLVSQKQAIAEKKLKQLKVNCPMDVNRITFPDNLVPNWENRTLEKITSEGVEETFNSITLITERLYDPLNNKYYNTLQSLSCNTDTWGVITVPKNYWKSSKLAELSINGLEVDQWNCRQLSNYLTKFERLNNDLIIKKTIAYQPGWEENEFVCPQLPSKNYGLTGNMTQALQTDFSSAGDIEESTCLIKNLKQLPIANFALGAALASPIVGIIGCENIHIHLYGNANCGKSVLFKAIFSILGNPNNPGVIPTSKTSLAGLEFYLAARRDLPAMIDDLNTINEDDAKPILHDLIMGFGNETGKMRGNLDLMVSHTYQMRGALLTNAEKMITDDFSNSGSKRRVIEIMLPSTLISSTFAEEIIHIIKHNYGLFFIDWLNYLQNNQATVKQTYNKTLTWLQTHYPQKINRQLHSVAAIITANQLFSETFLNTKETLEPYDEIIRQLRIKKAISDTTRVTQMISEWYQQNKDMFVPDTHKPSTLHYGFVNDKYVAIYPEVFDELIKSWGFHVNTVKKQLQAEGIIQKSSGRNLNIQLILQDKSKVRLVKIYANKLSTDNTDNDNEA